MNQQDTDKARANIEDGMNWDACLLKAVEDNNLPAVVEALNNGADINAKYTGNTSLYIGVSYNNEELVLSVREYRHNIIETVKALFNDGADFSALNDTVKKIPKIRNRTGKMNKIITQNKKQRDFRNYARSRINRNR